MVTLPRTARPRRLPRLGAMAVRASARGERHSISPSQTEAIELENVVRRAHQRPFTLHLLESTQQELPETTSLLDLADHWFDDALARGIDRRAGLRVQLAGHPIDDRGALWEGATRTGPRPLAMCLLPR